jgi:DNA (cytosine-5)-methyltransferase 1
MRLLDLFCGAGGAAVGYHRAGFTEIVGVDIKPQPRYPFTFVQGDALEYVKAHGHEFDAIHASPPCQAYIRSGTVAQDGRHRSLLAATRDALRAASNAHIKRAWIIENVPGSPIRGDVMLCGSMFELPVRRHRYFECSRDITCLVPHCDHRRQAVGVYGHPHGKRGAWPSMKPSTLTTWREAMDIDWMTAPELSQAIPPAYTEFIGRQLLQEIRA